jgi:uncharacterized protein (DUF39 family)
MKRSIEEINEKIRKGKAVVLRADEIVEMRKKEKVKVRNVRLRCVSGRVCRIR